SLDILLDNLDANCQYQLQDLLDQALGLLSTRLSWKILASSLKRIISK
ncbi:unnamed protein product, partial [Rotaria sp. Silwood2]